MVIKIRGILGASLPAVLCLAAVAAGQTTPTTSPAPADLKYIKKTTRAETLSATMAQYLPADVRLEPWRQVGPFDAPKNLEDALPPESGFDPQAHYTGKGGRPLSWQPADVEDGKVSSVAPAADAGKSAAYLDRQIVSKAPHYLTVDLGSSTPMVVWFNGSRVLKVDKARPCRIGDDELKLRLRAGVNHLLVKTVHADGPWEFGFGIAPTDPRLKAQLDYRLDADFPPTPEDAYYRIITVPVPDDVVLEVGGLDVLPGGRVAAATRRGEVWMIDDAYGKPPTSAKFSLFASGLHEPLGLVYKDGALLTTQRGEVTRLKDTTGAGQADLYETVCDQWNVSGDYHEFAFGPKFDRNGDMWVTLNVGFMRGTDQSHVPWRGWAVKISPDGKMEPQAMGLRSPAGFCMNADGDMFFSDNQGEWVGACIIQPLRKGLISLHPSGWKWAHLPGSPVRDPGTPPKGLSVVEAAKAVPIHLPAVWIPYGSLMGQSSTDVVCDTTGGRFGPFDKQMFVGDENGSLINRIDLEKVGGDYQGALLPVPLGVRVRRHPHGVGRQRPHRPVGDGLDVRRHEQPRLGFARHQGVRAPAPPVDR